MYGSNGLEERVKDIVLDAILGFYRGQYVMSSDSSMHSEEKKLKPVRVDAESFLLVPAIGGELDAEGLSAFVQVQCSRALHRALSRYFKELEKSHTWCITNNPPILDSVRHKYMDVKVVTNTDLGGESQIMKNDYNAEFRVCEQRDRLLVNIPSSSSSSSSLNPILDQGTQWHISYTALKPGKNLVVIKNQSVKVMLFVCCVLMKIYTDVTLTAIEYFRKTEV